MSEVRDGELVITFDDKHAATMLHVYARLVKNDGHERLARDLRDQAVRLKERL